MEFPKDQIDELKSIAPSLSIAEEGGYTYIHIKDLKLPEGCEPAVVDALLCPVSRDGYCSRLFFSSRISCPVPGLNWNGNIRVLGSNWYAISWRTTQTYRLLETLIIHLKAFSKQ